MPLLLLHKGKITSFQCAGETASTEAGMASDKAEAGTNFQGQRTSNRRARQFSQTNEPMISIFDILYHKSPRLLQHQCGVNFSNVRRCLLTIALCLYNRVCFSAPKVRDSHSIDKALYICNKSVLSMTLRK